MFNRFGQLWRTTTVRLTALFIVIFTVFSVALLAFISFQSSIQIQQQQAADIDHEVTRLQRVERNQGLRALAIAVDRLARQPGTRHLLSRRCPGRDGGGQCQRLSRRCAA